MRSPMNPENFIFARQGIAAAKKKERRDKIKSAKEKQKTKQRTKSVVLFNNYKTVPYRKGLGKEFYATREWRELRWEVLSTSTGKCMACGRSHSQHGVIMHIDHIKPRSKFPELELDRTNLQVLCEDCNLGKGARI